MPRSGVNGNAMKRKKSYFWRSKIPIFMTEGLRLAGKEGFDGNKAVGACFTGCPVLENCTRSVNDGAGTTDAPAPSCF